MKRSVLFLFCVLALSACDQKTTFLPVPGVGIVNGTPMSDQDALGKSVVALLVESDQGVALCTGSIYDEQTILTAAHCVDDGPDRVMIFFGPAVKVTSKSMVRWGNRYTQNPRWAKPGPEGQGDLALVHFDGGLPAGFQPVQLASPDLDLEAGTKVTMLGYGVADGVSKKGAGTLRSTTTTVEGFARKTEIVTDGHSSSVCFGDSGGPAFVPTASGFVQWGVASSVLNKACNEASVHTDIVSYEPWLRSAAAKLAQMTKQAQKPEQKMQD
jgi:secreted trypsin-like serine protease